jgi:hypothetical protein
MGQPVLIMNTLTVPKNEIETEAEDHAEETRYAVTHHGREMHPETKKSKPGKARAGRSSDQPWQVD